MANYETGSPPKQKVNETDFLEDQIPNDDLHAYTMKKRIGLSLAADTEAVNRQRDYHQQAMQLVKRTNKTYDQLAGIEMPDQDEDMGDLRVGDNVTHNHYHQTPPDEQQPQPQQPVPRPANGRISPWALAALSLLGGGGIGAATYGALEMLNRPTPTNTDTDTRNTIRFEE